MTTLNMLMATSHSGCSDRMRPLIAAKKLADETGREFTFIWLRNFDCGATFHDLFVAPGINVVSRMPELSGDCVCFDGYEFSRQPWALSAGRIKQLDDPRMLIHSFADDQPHDLESVGIDFSEMVKQRRDSFLDSDGRRSLLGCHVRMGDKGSGVPINKYFAAIDTLIASTDIPGIFVATDDVQTRHEFLHRYGKLLIWCDDIQQFYRNTREGMIDAVVELAILRSCKRLVLTACSGFSCMAIRGSDSVKGQGVRVVENNGSPAVRLST